MIMITVTIYLWCLLSKYFFVFFLFFTPISFKNLKISGKYLHFLDTDFRFSSHDSVAQCFRPIIPYVGIRYADNISKNTKNKMKGKTVMILYENVLTISFKYMSSNAGSPISWLTNDPHHGPQLVPDLLACSPSHWVRPNRWPSYWPNVFPPIDKFPLGTIHHRNDDCPQTVQHIVIVFWLYLPQLDANIVEDCGGDDDALARFVLGSEAPEARELLLPPSIHILCHHSAHTRESSVELPHGNVPSSFPLAKGLLFLIQHSILHPFWK